MTPQDRERLAHELEKPLGPEYISFKTGHAYIEGFKVINLANEIFGFDGWSSEIRAMETDYVDEKNGKTTVGISCRTRVTLKSGMWHEDVGYGSSINMPHKYQAFDKARKEASTDALKRALRMFGESVGNCIYSKEYVSMVKKVPAEKSTFDIEDLRRPHKRRRLEGVSAQPAAAAAPAHHHASGASARNGGERAGSGPAAGPRHEPELKPAVDPVYISSDDEDFPDLVEHEAAVRSGTPHERDSGDADITPMPADAVFVTADQAALVRNPTTNASPLPKTALFDTSHQSPAQNRYSLPQNVSSKILKRPKK